MYYKTFEVSREMEKPCTLIIKRIAEKVDKIKFFYGPYVSLLALRLLMIRSSA
jgi:hypothetical protein